MPVETCATPASKRLVGLAACRVAIAAPAAGNYLDEVASPANTVEGVPRHQNVIAAIDSKSCARCVVDDVIDDLDVICLIMKPRRGHELESGPLAGGEASGPGVIYFIGLDSEVG